MNQQKHLYETTCIINASIEDPQIETLISHIQEVITANGGENIVINRWGRKRLTYSLQKKNNGYYVNIEFLGPGTIVAPLERIFLLDENILRFLTIKLDKKAIKARLQPQAPSHIEPAEPVSEDRAPLFEDEEPAT